MDMAGTVDMEAVEDTVGDTTVVTMGDIIPGAITEVIPAVITGVTGAITEVIRMVIIGGITHFLGELRYGDGLTILAGPTLAGRMPSMRNGLT
jgi:hypothetical protein